MGSRVGVHLAMNGGATLAIALVGAITGIIALVLHFT
jgi:hypothetical protein